MFDTVVVSAEFGEIIPKIFEWQHWGTLGLIILVIVTVHLSVRHVKHEVGVGMKELTKDLHGVFEKASQEFTRMGSEVVRDGFGEFGHHLRSGLEQGISQGFQNISPSLQQLMVKIHSTADHFDESLTTITSVAARMIAYPQTSRNTEFNTLIAEVEGLIYDRELEQAKSKIDLASALHPGSSDLEILRARYLAAKGEFQQATEVLALAEIIMKDQNLPDLGEVDFATSRIFHAQSKFEEAERFCVKALERSPDDSRFLTALGFYCWRTGRIEDAVKYTEKAQGTAKRDRIKLLIDNNLTCFYSKLSIDRKDKSLAQLSGKHADSLRRYLGSPNCPKSVRRDQILESLAEADLAACLIGLGGAKEALRGLTYVTAALELNPNNDFALRMLPPLNQLIQTMLGNEVAEQQHFS